MLKKIRKLWYAFLLNYHPTVKAWVFLFEDLLERADHHDPDSCSEFYTCPIVRHEYGLCVKNRYRGIMDTWFDHYFEINTESMNVPFHQVFFRTGKTLESPSELRKRFLREMVQKFKTMEKM